MKYSKILFVISLLIILTSGCKKVDMNTLQGVWESEEPPEAGYYVWHRHTFEFECDKFYLHIFESRDYPFECLNHDGNLYISGTYNINGNILQLKAYYTDENWIPVDKSACYSGHYLKDFKFQFKNRKEILILNPDEEKDIDGNIEGKVTLTKKIDRQCTKSVE